MTCDPVSPTRKWLMHYHKSISNTVRMQQFDHWTKQFKLTCGCTGSGLELSTSLAGKIPSCFVYKLQLEITYLNHYEKNLQLNNMEWVPTIDPENFDRIHSIGAMRICEDFFLKEVITCRLPYVASVARCWGSWTRCKRMHMVQETYSAVLRINKSFLWKLQTSIGNYN